ncbi:hypothetical protein [Cellulomonas massiliensis]|uniref:hypothetical protein n=1 Tax=Cellulomonas massiliensis TaxID=1465811 RepID=UPI00037C467E|nr:hypothetical protein [Cellulomonas massiliensis]
MSTASSEWGPNLSPRLAGARWWGGAIVTTALGVAAGASTLLAGGPTGASVAIFALTATCAAYKVGARLESRRGWRQGYESSARVIIERVQGRVSDIETRAVLLGDPTPEPWDPHVPIKMPPGWRRNEAQHG